MSNSPFLPLPSATPVDQAVGPLVLRLWFHGLLLRCKHDANGLLCRMQTSTSIGMPIFIQITQEGRGGGISHRALAMSFGNIFFLFLGEGGGESLKFFFHARARKKKLKLSPPRALENRCEIYIWGLDRWILFFKLFSNALVISSLRFQHMEWIYRSLKLPFM